MGFCSLQERVRADLVNAKHLTSSGIVLDTFEVREADRRMRERMVKLYGKSSPNPLGTIVSGRLKLNGRTADLEQERYRASRKRYGNIEYGEWLDIPLGNLEDPVQVRITPITVSQAVRGEDAYMQTRFEEGIYGDPLSMFDVSDKKSGVYNENIENLLRDLKSFDSKNGKASISAIYPEITEDVYKARIIGEQAERAFKKNTKEAGGTKEYLEGLIEATADNSPFKIMNTLVNQALDKTKTLWTVETIKKRDQNSHYGHASASVVRVNPFGIAVSTEQLNVDYELAHTFVHEKIHLLTNKLMDTPAYRKHMEALYREAQASIPKEEGWYGMTNVLEFISEGLSNPAFQERLAQVPYQEESVWVIFIQRIADAIGNMLGMDINGSVLEELIKYNVYSLKNLDSNFSINRMNTEADFTIFRNTTQSGIYTGSASVSDVHDWANKFSLGYDAKVNKFYLNRSGSRNRKFLNKNEIDSHINRDRDDYITQEFNSGNNQQDWADQNRLEANTLNSLFATKSNIDGKIDKLIQFNQDQVVAPKDTESGKFYEIDSLDHYRTTAFLGSKGDDTKPNLRNGARIGNVVDELGKQVFRGDAIEDITFEGVNAIVVEERFDRESKEKGALTREAFDKTYLNPVSESAFYALKEEFIAEKASLEDEYDIVKFHTDIVGWDDTRLIAGEIDVLAEDKEGAYRVIDIKTRAKGLVDFGGVSDNYQSDLKKYTNQVNTYSMFLNNQGFTMKAPLLMVTKPNMDEWRGRGNKSEDVEDVLFENIDEDRLVTTVDLELFTFDETFDDQLFDIKTAAGTKDSRAAKEIKKNRADYIKWFRGKRTLAEKAKASNFSNSNENKKMLQKRLSQLAGNVKKYIDLLAKDTAKNTEFDKKLKLIEDQLTKDLKKEIDDVVFADQVNIAADFLEFAAEQFEELNLTLANADETNLDELRQTYQDVKKYKEIEVAANKLFRSIGAMYDNATDDEVYIALQEKYAEFNRVNAVLSSSMQSKLSNIFVRQMVDQYLGSKAEIKDKNAKKRELEQKYKSVNNKKARKEIIDQELREYMSSDEFRAELKEKYKAEIKEMMTDTQYDMKESTFYLNSDPSINNKFTMLLHSIISNAEQRYTDVTNAELIELSNLHKKLRLTNTAQKAIIDIGYEGQHYLKGEYSIKYYDTIKKQAAELREANKVLADLTKGTREWQEANAKATKISKRNAKWKKDNTDAGVGFDRVPIDKWKNDLSTLTPGQQEALAFFKKATRVAADRTRSQRALIESTYGRAVYYKLPAVLRTGYQLTLEGDVIGAAKKNMRDITSYEKSDVDMGDIQKDDSGALLLSTGLDGEVIHSVPLHFRNEILGKEQSTDLFTIYGMEIENGARYESFDEATKQTSIFMDMIKGAEFFKTQGLTKKRVTSKIGETDEETVFDTLTGEQAVVYKAMQKMLNNRIYGLTKQYAGDIKVFGGTMDIQRSMDLVGAYSAYAAMALKVLSATNNFITGNVTAYIEAAGEETYGPKDILSAQAFYTKHLPETMSDMGEPIDKSLINQLMAKFDVGTGNMQLQNEYERKGKILQLAKIENVFGLYTMGEHEISASIMLATLIGTKVTNKAGEYVDSKGKVVATKDKAASLLDAYSKNPKTGVIELAKWAEYTNFDTINSLKEGGEASMRMLIKDKVFRTQGDYDQKMQGELNRLWYGRLFTQFRKHIAPGALNRFRGANNALKNTEDLRDDQKYFNIQTKTEEYGYVVSFVRYLQNVIVQSKFDIMKYKKTGSDEWIKMTDHEKANVRKTITELSYIVTIILLASTVAAAADEEDSEALWTLAYLLRRQRADSGLQYISPNENFRLLESPMVALRSINNLGSALVQLTNPMEVYEGGKNNGESKLLIKMRRASVLFDRLEQFDDGYAKSMFNYFDR